MEKAEIQNEILSKIKIELDTLFYMPGETINGTIKINPEFKLKLNENKIHLKLKLIQYEFWEYNNIQIDELKNIYKTEVEIKYIEYQLKNEEKTDFNENLKFGNFSIIAIEKEEKDKFISIPFNFKLENNNKKLLPTFQFETENYILGIRHLLIVECEEYNSMNYIGLFIGKQKDNNFSEPKKINIKHKTKFTNADIEINFKKQTFYFGEKVIFKIHTNLEYKIFDLSLHKQLYRKIQWKGYMKNSLINKTIYEIQEIKQNKKNEDINDNELEIIGEIFELLFGDFGDTLDIEIGEFIGGTSLGITGSIIGGIICPNILLGIIAGGALSFIIGFITGGAVATNELDTRYYSDSQYYKSNTSKEINNVNKEQIKEELQKFVYFKEDKIIGFIKFKNNITPPIDGYYFKCDFNLKVDGKNALDFSKNLLKEKIDFYDGDVYIQNMKKALNVNSLI